MNKDNIFLNSNNSFIIGGKDFCTESDRTFDMELYQLARNRQILNSLSLESKYSHKKNGVEFFCEYLAAFSKQTTSEHLRSNPIIRVLVIDKNMLDKINKILEGQKDKCKCNVGITKRQVQVQRWNHKYVSQRQLYEVQEANHLD